MKLSQITQIMNDLESTISREQKYISKWGKANDNGEHDSVWENYKSDAQRNLELWDSLKSHRDALKAA